MFSVNKINQIDDDIEYLHILIETYIDLLCLSKLCGIYKIRNKILIILKVLIETRASF